MAFVDKFLGDQNEKTLKKLRPRVDRINNLEEEVKSFSESGLKEKTQEFKKRISEGEELDNILPEAYALVRETANRLLGERHYDVQLLGGIVLHRGEIAEMKTGEGKTLASTAPIYLNALTGKGVHVITVNDYLARRDTVWMGQVYNALGLTVGCVTHEGSFVYDENYVETAASESPEKLDEERDTLGSFKVEDAYLRPVERREAYNADITYGTNNEFGFDYLRDNLAQKKEDKVQREHYYAIIDEIDSILIDEARTPLIISAPDARNTEIYETFSKFVPRLKEEEDYTVDRKMRTVDITEKGIDKMEEALGIENLYDSSEGGGIHYVHALEQALKAHALFVKDKDYVVREGQVIIVDEFTGRLMPGRRYSEGLHQAIEAKEGVEIQRESRTMASISFQNYFRMYEKLAGMTGTAKTSEEEFTRVYGLDVLVIPTNKPLIRENKDDLIFQTEEGKYKALAREIKELSQKQRPVLIGTTSIEKNEHLSRLLEKEGVQHELLNAKNHDKEAQIIAQAGRLGAVTVATNMAGRGVDIVLGGNPPDKEEAEKVRELGGLHVIGTERHEARRIDNQLRGRAGRQGDPGSSQFYVSLNDEIMRVFGGEKIKSMMQTLNVPEDQPIENKMVSKAIENAQSKIEGMNFDARKHLLEYDEVLNKHRETIYKRRDEILDATDEEIHQKIYDHIDSYLDKMLSSYLASDYAEEWDAASFFEDVKNILPSSHDFDNEIEDIRKEIKEKDKNAADAKDNIKNSVFGVFERALQKKEEQIGSESMRKIERWLLLRTIDSLWTDHLDAMSHMRDSVRLRAYAQRDPLVEYKNEGLRMFDQLLDTIEADVVHHLFKIEINQQPPEEHSHDLRFKGAQKTAGSQPDKGKSQEGGSPPKKETTNRNDPCPCGSGKKYKKCGLINAPEHKTQ